jgi:putative ABC transport system permease protein
MGIQLARGRTFSESENRMDAPPVVVVNEALARRYFPGQDPIGKHITFGISHNFSPAPGDTLRARGEIVGIVRDARDASLAESPAPATYFPFHLMPFSVTFIVRTAVEPASLVHAIRTQAAAVDPTVPVYEIGTMNDALAASVTRPRFYTMLGSAFAAIALVLAALGIYGVVSYAVNQRAREFGIRLALGATSDNVVSLVVRRGARLTIVGLLIGLVGAFFVTKLIRSLLFGIEPLDPAAFATAAIVLGAFATLASWLPARRASRTDPVVTMRAEQ